MVSDKFTSNITNCDRLAADPYDLGKVTEGVDWGDLDADEAIPACLEAVNNWPPEVRLQYQLARAFQKAEHYSGALQIYKRLTVDPGPGYAAAQTNLGLMYRNGMGVPQNDAEAVKWYRKAAEQGYADAQYNLGNMYDKGRGVPEDKAEALKWWRKAAEQGHEDANEWLEFLEAK